MSSKSNSGAGQNMLETTEGGGEPAGAPEKPRILGLSRIPTSHPETMPRRVALIWEAREHAEERRAGETVVPQKGEAVGGTCLPEAAVPCGSGRIGPLFA